MACQAASHPETLRGQRYSMPCPTAKNWAPFVRGCAPEDAGANHDMRRVRLLDEQTVLATTGPANQPTGGSVLPSRRPQGLRRLSPADQRPGRITPAGDLTSSSPYPRHLTAMQLLSSSVRSDIEVMSPLDNPSRRSWGDSTPNGYFAAIATAHVSRANYLSLPDSGHSERQEGRFSNGCFQVTSSPLLTDCPRNTGRPLPPSANRCCRPKAEI